MESPRDHELDNPDPLCDGDFAFWVPCVCSELQQARQEARERALDAAQEAVERASSLFQPLGPALAAIDALREEQADPPPLPPSVGVPSKPMWPLREEQKTAHTPPSW